MFMNRVPLIVRLPLLSAALLIAAPSAQAALVLSYETTNQGGINVTTGPGTANVLSVVPSSTFYGNTLPGGLANLLPPPASAASYNFYDDFVINVPVSAVNTITSTIDFGDLLSISNLQVRLYGGAIPSLSASNVIEAWSTPISSGSQTGIVSVLAPTTLEAGDYILEVRGLVDGQFGGSYSGVLNIVPVPLPAAAWLLGSAIAGLGLFGRRRVSIPA